MLLIFVQLPQPQQRYWAGVILNVYKYRLHKKCMYKEWWMKELIIGNLCFYEFMQNVRGPCSIKS